MRETKSKFIEHHDRRQNQRFIARRFGNPCFWISSRDNAEHIPLDDLSLEGFGIPAVASLTLETPFDFVLHREGSPEEVHGLAKAVNHVNGPNGQISGCKFIQLTEQNMERLQEWLIEHVMANATIRITEKEARTIVLGRSLI